MPNRLVELLGESDHALTYGAPPQVGHRVPCR
jgi:hypothetical protein